MSEAEQTCRNGGCRKKFLPSSNTDESCAYHPGKPIFHDFKKGWTCCNVTVLDWDEFEKIAPCAKGKHSSAKENLQGDQSDFYKSSTVANAEKAILRDESEPKKVQNIGDLNKAEEEKAAKLREAEAAKPQVPVKTAEGLFKCKNGGCNKAYSEEENKEDSCSFHSGQPIFHDIRKFWSCCKDVIVYDWDDFMKIEKCQKGPHVPKTKPAN